MNRIVLEVLRKDHIHFIFILFVFSCQEVNQHYSLFIHRLLIERYIDTDGLDAQAGVGMGRDGEAVGSVMNGPVRR